MAKDYRKEAKEYLSKYIDVKEDIISGEIYDLDHLAEMLIDSIDTDYREDMTDEDFEKEAERERHEIYNLLLDKYEDIVNEGLKIRKERG